MPRTTLKRTSTVSTAFFLAVLLSGCTTQLTEGGENVSLITAAKASGCELINSLTVQGSSADDALNSALNETAKLGGDSLAVESVDEVGGDTEIKGGALKCRQVQ